MKGIQTMVFIDSDLIIRYLRGKNNHAIQVFNQITSKNKVLRTTIFNYCELIEGAYLSKNVPRTLRYIQQFLKKFEVVEFTFEDADTFSKLHAELIKNGTPIGDFDTLIAAMVMNRKDILITRNKKHFLHIPMFNFKNWDEL